MASTNQKDHYFITQTNFFGGQISDDSNPTVVREQLTHASRLTNFDVLTNGIIQKRKGVEFAVLKGANTLVSQTIGENERIIFSSSDKETQYVLNITYVTYDSVTKQYKEYVLSFSYEDDFKSETTTVVSTTRGLEIIK